MKRYDPDQYQSMAMAWAYASRVIRRLQAMASAATAAVGDGDVAMSCSKYEAAGGSGDWKCKRCTLSNPSTVSICVGCHSARMHFPVFKVSPPLSSVLLASKCLCDQVLVVSVKGWPKQLSDDCPGRAL